MSSSDNVYWVALRRYLQKSVSNKMLMVDALNNMEDIFLAMQAMKKKLRET